MRELDNHWPGLPLLTGVLAIVGDDWNPQLINTCFPFRSICRTTSYTTVARGLQDFFQK